MDFFFLRVFLFVAIDSQLEPKLDLFFFEPTLAF